MAIELILICKDEGQIGRIGFILENIKNWKMWEIYLKANALQIVLIPNGGGKKKKKIEIDFLKVKKINLYLGWIVGRLWEEVNLGWMWNGYESGPQNKANSFEILNFGEMIGCIDSTGIQ